MDLSRKGEVIRQEARSRWLQPVEIREILYFYSQMGFTLGSSSPSNILNGSLFLYDRLRVPNFRDDGIAWVRKKNPDRVREDFHKILIYGEHAITGLYTYSSSDQNLRRRCYRLPASSSIFLVHYRLCSGHPTNNNSLTSASSFTHPIMFSENNTNYLAHSESSPTTYYSDVSPLISDYQPPLPTQSNDYIQQLQQQLQRQQNQQTYDHYDLNSPSSLLLSSVVNTTSIISPFVSRPPLMNIATSNSQSLNSLPISDTRAVAANGVLYLQQFSPTHDGITSNLRDTYDDNEFNKSLLIDDAHPSALHDLVTRNRSQIPDGSDSQSVASFTSVPQSVTSATSSNVAYTGIGSEEMMYDVDDDLLSSLLSTSFEMENSPQKPNIFESQFSNNIDDNVDGEERRKTTSIEQGHPAIMDFSPSTDYTGGGNEILVVVYPTLSDRYAAHRLQVYFDWAAVEANVICPSCVRCVSPRLSPGRYAISIRTADGILVAGPSVLSFEYCALMTQVHGSLSPQFTDTISYPSWQNKSSASGNISGGFMTTGGGEEGAEMSHKRRQRAQGNTYDDPSPHQNQSQESSFAFKSSAAVLEALERLTHE